MPSSNPTLDVYKASAGSGKTFQLALKYIGLLLGERRDDGSIRLYTSRERKAHREILAITFTNKATEEMKQRIIKELALLANPESDSNFRPGLLAKTGASAAQLAKAAEDALTSMLFDYGKIRVSTIDSFFQRILRSFAYEADLSGNYELSLDTEDIIIRAIAEMLTQVCGYKGHSAIDRRRLSLMRSWIEAIVADKFQRGKDTRVFDKNSPIRAQLVKFIKDLSSETYQTKKEEINRFFEQSDAVDLLTAALQGKKSQLIGEIATQARAILNHADAKLLHGGRIGLIKKADLMDIDILSAGQAEYLKGKDPLCLFKNAANASPVLIGEIQMLVEKMRKYFTVSVMLEQMYHLGLFHELLDVQSRIKVHLNTILLSDTNTMLNEIIADSDTPFIYERIGQQLRHFLIDEFQDTSMLQWCNLLPLVTNSLGSGYDNMIIGDVKQCIYRFRNSYPGLLDNELQNDNRLARAIKLPVINTNWRSSGHVVDFNNDLFENIGNSRGITSYQSARQNYPASAKDGYVDILATQDFEATYVRRMAEHMRRQLDSGYRASDIVVLVRYNKDAATIVNLLLPLTAKGEVLHDVSIISNEGLLLSSTESVKYIISQLRELDRLQPSSDTPRVIGRSGLPKTTDRELDWLQNTLRDIVSEGSDKSDDALEEVLRRFDERNRAEALSPDDDAAWRRRMRGRSVFEIVEEIISALPDPDWQTDDAQYLSAFQDLVVEYCRRGAPSVHGFLELWDEKYDGKAAVGLAENTNAIRVMSIHKSKGLEFDCVHLPMSAKALYREKDLQWFDSKRIFANLALGCPTPDFFPLKSSASLDMTDFADEHGKLLHDQIIDELNVLYVAMTRPKRELIMTLEATDAPITATEIIRSNLPQKTYGILERSGWECTSGAPTRKAQAEGKGSDDKIDIININRYEVFDRLDTWHNTEVAKDDDTLLS